MIESLTDREKQVLELIKNGSSNKEIADSLVLALSTVKTHVSSILQKTKVKSRAKLMIMILKNDILLS